MATLAAKPGFPSILVETIVRSYRRLVTAATHVKVGCGEYLQVKTETLMDNKQRNGRVTEQSVVSVGSSDRQIQFGRTVTLAFAVATGYRAAREFVGGNVER